MINYSERNRSIYEEYTKGGTTYAKLGAKYGVSATTIRQIVFKIQKRKDFVESLPSQPVLVKDILLPRRVYNALYNQDLSHVTIKDFLQLVSTKEILGRMPNYSKVSHAILCKEFKKHGYHVDAKIPKWWRYGMVDENGEWL